MSDHLDNADPHAPDRRDFLQTAGRARVHPKILKRLRRHLMVAFHPHLVQDSVALDKDGFLHDSSQSIKLAYFSPA